MLSGALALLRKVFIKFYWPHEKFTIATWLVQFSSFRFPQHRCIWPNDWKMCQNKIINHLLTHSNSLSLGFHEYTCCFVLLCSERKKKSSKETEIIEKKRGFTITMGLWSRFWRTNAISCLELSVYRHRPKILSWCSFSINQIFHFKIIKRTKSIYLVHQLGTFIDRNSTTYCSNLWRGHIVSNSQ